MYYGDWLRTGDIKKEWYISFSSPHDDYSKRIADALRKKGQVRKVSPACLLIESTDSQKSIIKKVRRVIKSDESTVFLFPHHKIIGHMVLVPEGEEPPGVDTEEDDDDEDD